MTVMTVLVGVWLVVGVVRLWGLRRRLRRRSNMFVVWVVPPTGRQQAAAFQLWQQHLVSQHLRAVGLRQRLSRQTGVWQQWPPDNKEDE